MVKKVGILLLILPIFLSSITLTLFVYSDQTQRLIISYFNLKKLLSEEVKSFISKKINSEDITVKINTIKLLEPNWPDIIKIELNDIDIYSIDQKRKSNIHLIEIGFSYENFLRNIFFHKNNLEFSYLNFKDLTLNAKLEKNKFIPGPLVKILSLINQKGLENQKLLKKILQNKIMIGKTNILLLDQRKGKSENVFKIICENVFVSKYLNRSRFLNMNCNHGKKFKFFVKGDLYESFNNFNVNIQNLDPKLFFSDWFQEKFKFNAKKIFTNFNGNFNIVTDKKLSVKNVIFSSKQSNLILENNKNVTLNTEFSGDILWDRRENLLKFNNFSIGDIDFTYAEFDFNSRIGSSKFKVKKLSTTVFKNHLNSLENFYNSFLNFNVLKNFGDTFKKGSFNNINLDLKFSYLKKINIIKLNGKSNFTNIKFNYNDKIFERVSCNISGDLKFQAKINNNEIMKNHSWIKINVNASNGLALLRKNRLEYKFDSAKIIFKAFKKKIIITKANFFKKDLELTFKDVDITHSNYRISKAIVFRNNKIQFIFEDMKMRDLVITHSKLKVKNNSEVSYYIQKNLNIEIIGDIDLNFIFLGNIKSLDLNLILDSDLTKSALRINFLGIEKKKNIKSSIKSEIIFKNGELAILRGIKLKIEKKNYETSLIKLNNKSFSEISFKNVKTPFLDLKRLSITNKNKNYEIYTLGKKIDLSKFKNNLQKKSNLKQINFDITADNIILDPKITLTGNLKGIINQSIFEATAFGKMLLDKSSVLDSGKFKIYFDDKLSKLNGFGLVGGAETKIIMKKIKDKLPQISFDTSDGGKLLKSFGFTENIRSGKMKLKINFLDNDYDHYKGTIEAKKFSLINAPGIINSLSVLSFSGIQSVISGEGVYFDKGKASIYFKNNFFHFDKVYLTSESLGIAAKGKINLKKKFLDMRGSVAPIKLISQIISIVPAVGELITGLKKEGLIAGQFKMVGPIKRPKVELNTMSFAPGILRNLFAEDWLDNNNFFLKDELN